jgi:hypothetical protein
VLAFTALGAAAADADEAAKRVVERSNAFRAEQGLKPQQVDEALERAAREFARFMADTGKFGHTADGRPPAERASAAGYDYCMVLENLAYQYRSGGFDSDALSQALVEGWKQSPEHRESLLEPAATQTGVGLAQGKDGRWVAVQMFGRPKSAAIRFSVENRAGHEIEYRAGERPFALPPRAIRTHMVCRPTDLAIALASAADAFTTGVRDGATYTVLGDRVVESDDRGEAARLRARSLP